MDERTAVQVLTDLRRECSGAEWDAVTAAIDALSVLGRRRETASPVVVNSLQDLVAAAADRGFPVGSSPAGLFVELDRLRAIEQDLIAIRDATGSARPEEPISAAQVAAFRRAWWRAGGELPHLARAADFDGRDDAFDMHGMQEADAWAECRNDDAIRAAVAAAWGRL